MKKNLLIAALLFVAGMMSATDVKVDTASYAETNLYKFESLWMYARFPAATANFPTDGFGSSTVAARGMAGKDNKILICYRASAAVGGTGIDKYVQKSGIFVYDGPTGSLVRTIELPDSIFNVKDAASDTLRAVGYPNNDIQVDGAGNVVVMGMTTSLDATPFIVAALKVDLNTGVISQVNKLLHNTYPETKNGTSVVRFDAFNIYGDMFGDGYIMAAVAGAYDGLSNNVLKWDVKDGIANATFDAISIARYVPIATKYNDTAPRVKPISENLFYLDGNLSYPTIYDMSGLVIDTIPKAVWPASSGNNGVDEFVIADHNFVVYSNGNTATAPKSSWALGELGSGMSLSTMSKLYAFPKGGMGDTSNPVRTAVPYIYVSGASAYIYVYGFANGLAAYKLTLKPTGLNKTEVSAVTLSYENNKIRFSEVVTSADVYSVTGQKLNSYKNLTSFDAPVVKGVYLISATDKSGAKLNQKVIVK